MDKKPLYTPQTTYQATGEPWGTTCNTEPTLTDQAGATETDINIIVGRMMPGGTTPGAGEPLYGDFTNMPQDLRSFIETSRSLEEHRLNLPEPLRNLPLEDLLYLTPEALAAKLQPAKPADKPEDTPK